MLISVRTTYKREKKICPLCKDEVTNLPRHLQSRKHGFSKKKAKLALQDYQLRKPYTYAHKKNNPCKKKDYHRRRICPYPGCKKRIINLPEHLQKVHRIERSREYYNLLRSAVVVGQSGILMCAGVFYENR